MILLVFFYGMINYHFKLEDACTSFKETKETIGACTFVISILCHTSYLNSTNVWTSITLNNVIIGTQTGGYLAELYFTLIMVKQSSYIFLNYAGQCQLMYSTNTLAVTIKYK